MSHLGGRPPCVQGDAGSSALLLCQERPHEVGASSDQLLSGRVVRWWGYSHEPHHSQPLSRRDVWSAQESIREHASALPICPGDIREDFLEEVRTQQL